MKLNTMRAIILLISFLISFSALGNENTGKLMVVIENDKQSISAYKGEKKIWTVNVINELGPPVVGPPEVRSLRLEEEFVFITYGKHSFAKANLNTGKLIYLGSD